MVGSFDGTLGSDPVHQDRPRQWARLVDLTRFLIRSRRMIVAPNEARRIAANIAKLPDLLSAEQRRDGNPLEQRRP